MSSCHLDIQSLNFAIGGFSLRDVHFRCRRAEYHILLGPTGSGKSTLMKCILGIYRPKGGSIHLNGKNISADPPECRSMGYLPQDFALFPHLNVERNIRFGLHPRKLPLGQADELVNRLCHILKIDGLRNRGVKHLSGGEKQKVALARALASQPEIILLDEPFSSIDEGARRLLWFELKRAIAEVGITAIHITHNLEEAYTLGEQLSVLIDGVLVQRGARQEIFERPASERVARYLNYRNVFSGRTEKFEGGTRINLRHFSVVVKDEIQEGRGIALCIRPQDLKIVRESVLIRDSLRRNVFSGEIVALFPLPEHCVMLFKINGSPQRYDLELRFPIYIKKRHDLYVGKKVRVAVWEPSIIVFRD